MDNMYCINDLLTILSFVKIIPIVRLLARVYFFRDILIQRVLDQYETKETFIFTFNGVLKRKPQKFLLISLIISVFIFAFIIRVAETPYLLANYDENAYHLEYITFLWLTFITMSTVGYGDVYPVTSLGRFLTFILCIWGLFLMSIIVIILFQSLELSYEEQMSLLIFNKLKIKAML